MNAAMFPEVNPVQCMVYSAVRLLCSQYKPCTKIEYVKLFRSRKFHALKVNIESGTNNLNTIVIFYEIYLLKVVSYSSD